MVQNIRVHQKQKKEESKEEKQIGKSIRCMVKKVISMETMSSKLSRLSGLTEEQY